MSDSTNVPDGATWVRLASVADLEEDTAVHVDYDSVPVCLARSAGQLHAIVDRCTHQDVPLSEGEVENGTIECYMHGSRFDLTTGKALGPPAIDDVTVFPLRVEGNDIYVAVPPNLAD